MIFNIHKYYAIALVALNGWLVLSVLNHSDRPSLRRLSIALAALTLGTIVIGMSMDRLHLPMFAQPLHLWLASLIFGTQLAIMLIIRHARAANDAPHPESGLELSTGQV